jgi:hypothetical protein
MGCLLDILTKKVWEMLDSNSFKNVLETWLEGGWLSGNDVDIIISQICIKHLNRYR